MPPSRSKNKKEIQRIGSRAQVMNGTAKQTSGGLKAKDLVRHNGRIKSRKAMEAAKRINNLGSYKLPKAKRGQKGVFIPGGAR